MIRPRSGEHLAIKEAMHRKPLPRSGRSLAVPPPPNPFPIEAALSPNGRRSAG